MEILVQFIIAKQILNLPHTVMVWGSYKKKNMNFWRLISIIIMISLFSCKNQNHKINQVLRNSKDVSCKILPVDFLLGVPYQIKLINDILVIADNSDENSMVLYDYKNSQLIGSILKRGQGPNEVLTPLLLETTSESSVVSVFQRQTGKYTEYQIDDLLKNNVEPTKALQFENTDRLIRCRDGYISEGEYENGSINLLDISGNYLHTENIYPHYINELQDTSNKYICGQGVIGYNKKDNIFVFASFFTGEICFYSLEGNLFNLIKKDDYSINSSLKNRVKSNPQNVSIQQNDVEYFSDICSSERNIYVLYSGVSMKNKRSVDYSHILKYSSKGELLGSYKTDMKITNFCVESDKKIYAIGISKEFEYCIVEIRID